MDVWRNIVARLYKPPRLALQPNITSLEFVTGNNKFLVLLLS
jgi:hypothetical protein